jgi:hypothetical protein
MDERETTASTMSMSEIYAALKQRLVALGWDPATVPERAVTMLVGWDRLTDYDAEALGTGGRTVDCWIDAEVVRLCDAGLCAYYIGKEPYPTAPA